MWLQGAEQGGAQQELQQERSAAARASGVIWASAKSLDLTGSEVGDWTFEGEE